MYEFANFLLLALFAAAAFDLAAAWRRTGSLRAGLDWLWHNEHFLFGEWQAPRRAAWGPVLFCVGIATYELSVLFCNSAARLVWSWVQGTLAPILGWIAMPCLAVKILLGTRYSWRGLGLAGALYFIARWVHFNSHNIWFIWIVVAVLAAKDVDLRQAMRWYFAAGAAAIAVVLALDAAGLLPSMVAMDYNGRWRRGFGYTFHNTFGGFVLGLLLAWLLLRAKKLRWHDVVLSALTGLFLWFGPTSRTPALSAFLLTALLAVYLVWPKLYRFRAIPWLAAASVPAVAALSFLLPLGLSPDGSGPAWLLKLNNALTGRLYLSRLAYDALNLKIAGQILPDQPALDNSFFFLLYQMGPVMLLILMVLFAAALWGTFRSGKIVWGCCLLAMLAYGFSECQTIHLTTNPTALLLCGAAFLQPPEQWGEPAACHE